MVLLTDLSKLHFYWPGTGFCLWLITPQENGFVGTFPLFKEPFYPTPIDLRKPD